MKIKVKNLLISCGVALIMCALCILPNLFVKSNEVATRTIDVSEIGTLSYEDKVDQLKEQFTNISVDVNEEFTYFQGDVQIDQLQLLSTDYEGENVVNHISTSINNQTDAICIEIQTTANEELVDDYNAEFTTYFDEATETFLLIGENGEEIDLLQELDEVNVDDCFVWFLAPVAVWVVNAIVVAAAATATIYVATHAEQIAESIATLTAGIRDGVTSVLDRLRIKLGIITAAKLDKPFVITVDNVESLQRTAEKRQDCYLLCEAISSTAEITTLYAFTNLANASLWIKKGGSVWSPYSTTAQACITNAGYIPMIQSNNKTYLYQAERHPITTTTKDGEIINYSFYHYHAGDKKTYKKIGGVHSFFGLPFTNN